MASLSVVPAILALSLVATGAAKAQYSVPAPSGDTALSYPEERIRALLERTRELYDILEEDPEILYYIGYGPDAPNTAPEGAYPWNAVRVESDSVVRVVTPENLREADRAYYNYAVTRMRERGEASGDESCDELVSREARILSAFVDGWIVSRTAFGAAPYAPLDELPFVQEAGLLPAFVAVHGAPALGDCEDRWSREHPDLLEDYANLRRLIREGGRSGEADPGR